VIKYGGHADQLSTTMPMIDIYRIRAMEKHVDDGNLKPEWSRALFTELVYKIDVLISGGQKRGNNVDEWLEKRKRYASQVDGI